MWLTQMHVPVRKLPLSAPLFRPHWPPGCPRTRSTVRVPIFFPADDLFWLSAWPTPSLSSNVLREQCSLPTQCTWQTVVVAYFIVSIVPSTSQCRIFLCVFAYGTSASNYQGRDTTCVVRCCTCSLRNRNSHSCFLSE